MNAQFKQSFSSLLKTVDRYTHFIRVGRTIYLVKGKAYHIKSISRVLDACNYETSNTVIVSEVEQQNKPWLKKAINSELYLDSDLIQLNGLVRAEKKRAQRTSY